MQHILKETHNELERTHSLIENYKISGVKELFFSFWGTSFKRVLLKYAHQKEEILINYTSIYSEFSKDIRSSKAKTSNETELKNAILEITESIEQCGEILEQLIAHSHRQEEIVHHEKLFFIKLLESFNSDLLEWVGVHEKAIFGETTKLESVGGKTKLESGKALLELRKKRLESYMENIPKK